MVIRLAFVLEYMMRRDLIQKELKFTHDGNEYIAVVVFTEHKLKQAKELAPFNAGAVLNSAHLYDMTAFRRKYPK